MRTIKRILMSAGVAFLTVAGSPPTHAEYFVAEQLDNCRDTRRDLTIERREAFCALLFWNFRADDKTRAEAHFHYALIYLRAGQYERATNWLNYAVTDIEAAGGPRELIHDIVAYLAHAEALQGQASPQLDAALAEARNKTSTVAYLAGLRALDRGDLEAAVRQFDYSIAMDPGHVDSLIGRARALTSLDRDGEAERDMDDVIRISPNNAPARSMKGIQLLGTGKAEEALHQFALAVRLDRDNYEARVFLARMLGARGVGETDHLRVLHHAREALRLNRNNPDRHYDVAILATLTGNPMEAFHHHRIVAYEYAGYAEPYQRELIEKGFLPPGSRDDWDEASDTALRACIEARCIPFGK